MAPAIERWKENPYGSALGDRDVIDALGASPERLKAVAGRMTPAQFERSYAPGKWTAVQLFLHLAQTEAAFGVRVRMALTTPGYVVQPFEQDAWLQREPLVSGQDAFLAYYGFRQFNLPLFRSLTAAERAQSMHHPERGTFYVEWILEMLAGHELHHLQHFETIAESHPE